VTYPTFQKYLQLWHLVRSFKLAPSFSIQFRFSQRWNILYERSVVAGVFFTFVSLSNFWSLNGMKKLSAILGLSLLISSPTCALASELDNSSSAPSSFEIPNFFRQIKTPFIQPPQPHAVMLEDSMVLGEPSLVLIKEGNRIKRIPDNYLLYLPITVPMDKKLDFLRFSGLIRMKETFAQNIRDGVGSKALRDEKFKYKSDIGKDLTYQKYVKALHDEPRPIIVSVYPVHDFLTALFKHSTSLSASISPQYMGASAGSLTGTVSDESNYLADLPLVTGAWDNYTSQVSWEFTPQSKKLITQGIIPLFALIRTNSNNFVLTVSPVMETRSGLIDRTFYGADRDVDTNFVQSSKDFLRYHGSELPDAAQKLIHQYVDDEMKTEYVVTITPSTSATETKPGQVAAPSPPSIPASVVNPRE